MPWSKAELQTAGVFELCAEVAVPTTVELMPWA
jgi:hypothetical protein